MTPEEKRLLLIDLCARLPYGVKVHITDEWFYDKIEPYDRRLDCDVIKSIRENQYTVKPYLRPISSMTTEEWCEYCDSCVEDEKEVIFTHKGYRIVPTTHKEHFFNIHHFDYRSLIEKGLALEAPEGMYKTE